MTNRRNMIKALSFLAVSVIMLAFFMIFFYRSASENMEMSERELRTSYYSLCDSVAEMNSALDGLCSLPEPAEFSEYAARLKSASDAALAAVDRLPLAKISHENFTLCLAQSGGYGIYAARNRSEGSFDGENENALLLLRMYLREALCELYAVGEELSGVKNTGDIRLETLTSVSEFDRLFSDYSPLYYDGEYSATVKATANAYERENAPVDKKQASELASAILGKNLTLTYTDGKLSELSVYSFHCNNAFVDIAKNGGYPVRIFIATERGEGELDEKVLLERMSAFAGLYGYKNTVVTERSAENGIFYATFCYVYGEGGQRVTDLTASVKIGCTVNKGRICYLDGNRYLKRAGSETDIPAGEGERVIIFDGSGVSRLCRRENGSYFDCASGEKIRCPRLE